MFVCFRIAHIRQCERRVNQEQRPPLPAPSNLRPLCCTMTPIVITDAVQHQPPLSSDFTGIHDGGWTSSRPQAPRGRPSCTSDWVRPRQPRQ